MEDDFDISAAVDEIGSGLGFEAGSGDNSDDVILEVGAKEVPAPTPSETSTTPTEAATETAAAPAADAPPKTWRKEASATWAALPSEAKAEILKRESDIFKGIEGYKVAADYGKTMQSVIAPYEPYMRAAGIAPEQALAGILQGHHMLGKGSPEQKMNAFLGLVKAYNIDLAAAASQVSNSEPPYVDPTVAALQKELQDVKSYQTRLQERERQQAVTTVSNEVNAFAADPANLYYNEVEPLVATLLQRGQAGTLKEAYEQAIWLVPAVREKEIARRAADANPSPTNAEAAKVALARKALGANVKTRAKSGSATTPLGSLDDTLEATLSDIRSRA